MMDTATVLFKCMPELSLSIRGGRGLALRTSFEQLGRCIAGRVTPPVVVGLAHVADRGLQNATETESDHSSMVIRTSDADDNEVTVLDAPLAARGMQCCMRWAMTREGTTGPTSGHLVNDIACVHGAIGAAMMPPEVVRWIARPYLWVTFGPASTIPTVDGSALLSVVMLGNRIPGFRADDTQTDALKCIWSLVHAGLVGRDDPLRDHQANLLECLTTTQRRVAALLIQGLRQKEISSVLGQSVYTTHDHVKAIYYAWGVNSRAQLMALWAGSSPARVMEAVPSASDVECNGSGSAPDERHHDVSSRRHQKRTITLNPNPHFAPARTRR